VPSADVATATRYAVGPMPQQNPRTPLVGALVLMGVSGTGKSTIGRMLCDRLGWPLYDGDDLHPPANVAKMARGEPLDDDDRMPWLQRIADLIRRHLDEGRPAVFICSALKRQYREVLLIDPRVRLVWLKGDYDLILERMTSREGHYMKPGMLQSQFRDLEPPEDAPAFDIDRPPEAVVDAVLAHLAAAAHGG